MGSVDVLSVSSGALASVEGSETGTGSSSMAAGVAGAESSTLTSAS